jgi:hypothetical protein
VKDLKAILSALVIGLILGGGFVYLYMDRAQVTVDTKQVKKDNETAAEVTSETTEAIKANTVVQTVVKWKEKPVRVPRDLTNEEIDNLCVNRAVPADIMQSIRSEAAKARARFNDL